MSENMKNILLVMSSQGILVPPPSEENKEREPLWNETWKRLDRFLPHLFAEIFPEEVKKPRSAAPTAPKRSTESQQAPGRTGTPSNAAQPGGEEKGKEASGESKA